VGDRASSNPAGDRRPKAQKLTDDQERVRIHHPRRRPGRPGSRPRAAIRPVLHDQAAGRRHRPRAVRLIRHRRRTRWSPLVRAGAGQPRKLLHDRAAGSGQADERTADGDSPEAAPGSWPYLERSAAGDESAGIEPENKPNAARRGRSAAPAESSSPGGAHRSAATAHVRDTADPAAAPAEKTTPATRPRTRTTVPAAVLQLPADCSAALPAQPERPSLRLPRLCHRRRRNRSRLCRALGCASWPSTTNLRSAPSSEGPRCGRHGL